MSQISGAMAWLFAVVNSFEDVKLQPRVHLTKRRSALQQAFFMRLIEPSEVERGQICEMCRALAIKL